MTETEAQATLAEIREFGRGRGDTGEDLPLERAAREWDECCGYAFRRHWYLMEPQVGERRYLPGGRELGPGMLGKLVGAVLPGLRPLMEGGFSMPSVLTHAALKLLLYASEALRGVPVPDRSARYHVRLVGALTGWQVSGTEAQVVGKEVLEHQAHLGQRTRHDMSVGNAAIDYFKRLGFSGLGRSSLWEKGWRWETEYGEIQDCPGACIPCPA